MITASEVSKKPGAVHFMIEPCNPLRLGRTASMLYYLLCFDKGITIRGDRRSVYDQEESIDMDTPFACNGRRQRNRTVSLFAKLKRRSKWW